MPKNEQDSNNFMNTNQQDLENSQTGVPQKKISHVPFPEGKRLPSKEFVLQDYEDKYNIFDYPDEEKNNRKKKKRRKKGNIFKRLLTIVIILGIAVGLAFAILLSASDFMGVGKENIDITFNIPQGSSTADIAKILKENNIIKYDLIFRLSMRMQDADGSFYYGIFTLNPSMTYTDMKEVLQKVPHGNSITFIEGGTVESYANKLQQEGICKADDFLEIINNPPDILKEYKFMQYIDSNSLVYHKLEGYAFPDTYDFDKNTPALQVAADFLGNFDSKITDEHYLRMQELGLSFTDVITLASIIEKEGSIGEDKTVVEKNMKDISAVFHNRLNNPEEYPYLQSDPTRDYVNNYVTNQYEVGSEKYEIYASAYSTFPENNRRKGLPAGPICSPSLTAIEAALYPNSENMQGIYFFVTDKANPEKIYYASTDAQHEYNKILANQY